MNPKLSKFLAFLLSLAMLISNVPASAITVTAVGSDEINSVAEGNVAKVGNTEYATIDEAIANWTNNTTLTLLADVTLSDVVTLKSTEHHILNLATYTMTAASGKNAFVIKACGTGDSERTAITINADANNPGGINAGKKCVVYYKYADGGISTEDRPIIKINGGVFTGSTSSFGTAGIYTIGTAARKCATLNISGGTFNCSINGSGKSKLLIFGGTFNYSVGSQGDSTALRLISGGKFKTLGFMTADSNNTKFWFGTSMGNSNVGLYVDENNYLVVGGPVITEVSAEYPAVASNATKWSSYLAYSSAATYGLFYKDADMAIAKHGAANVTVYEKPAVVIPETLTGDVVEEIKNNDALKGYAPEKVPAGAELVIELVSVEDKIVFDVTPMANGVKVEPTEAITFRLPVPASVTETHAKVYHDGALMGIYLIQGEDNAKYVEISSANFSEFAVEPVKAVAQIDTQAYETLADAIAAAQAGQTITFIADINENVTIDKALTIDGAKFTYTGEMILKADATIKNVNFDGKGYNGYAITTRGANYVTIEDCTAKGYGYGLLQTPSGTVLTTVKNVTISGMNYGIKIDYSNTVVLENVAITGCLFGVMDSNYGVKTFTLKNCNIDAQYPLALWDRNADIVSTFKFEGNNTLTAPAGEPSVIVYSGNTSLYAIVLDKNAALTATANLNVDTIEGYELKYENGTYTSKEEKKDVVMIGTQGYKTLAEAITAATAGQTITFLADITEDVTINKAITIDGAGKIYTGAMTLTADTTIKNVNFDGQGYNGYAVTTRGAQYVTIDGCTAKNYGYGFVQLASATALTTVKNITVSKMNYGVKVDYSGAVVLENADITAGVAAVLNSNYGEKTITIKNSKLNILDTWTRDNTTKTTYVFEGANTIDSFIIDAAIDNFKLAAGATLTAPNDITVTTDVTGGYVEYEDGKYFVMMGLKGEGTKENPYLIGSVNDLIMFRDSVNAGETKYSAPGVYVVLTADIDLEGINWVGIGSAYIDHGFMGNFDGNGYKIKNLTITNPAVDSDGYAYAGLFAVTEGTDKDNQNFIKNLIIENVTIKTTGHIVAAAIAYPYYTIVENVTVCGDIKIEGGNYTAGALAYTRRCVDASKVTVSGNAGSYIKGAQTVGGVISDIQMNGGLIANYSNFSASGLTISGTKQVGGIAGIIGAQTLNGATVKNVAIDCADDRKGIIAGSLGGISTITNATYENVTGATAEVGADYDTGKPIEAKLGDKYYKTFAAAYAAAEAGDTITLLVDMSLSQILVIDKAITLNGNGHKLTSTAGRAINVSGTEDVTIKNLTINCTGERAINIIQNATNVTIENVTATAKNYTVNVAASAPNAVVTINDSTLNGLCTVNVSAADAKVAIDKSIINCNDNNATVGESYAALSLNKDGKGGSIVATNTTVNVTEGSDSTKGRNGAENGTVTINGSTEDVVIMVAAITYAGSDNYHAFQTLESAFAFAKNGDTITLIRDIAISEGITNTKKITLDLNGKTITGTDNATASFAIITNKGELTITGNGKITLKATNNRGWSAYSSIISNTVGGKLIVENGTIEHLGGTDMAYAIDNLTNGKGTKAETVINGGTVKSTYRAIRMFLNGVEAQNILTINGGVVEGANKSVWMQDANKNLNPGKLTVTEDATLKGDVYLTVTAGSAEWPVEVAIAASAVNGQVLTSNAPAGYALLNTNGVWGVDKYTAKVGEQHFKTLQEAIANANDGDTITLLTDVALENTVLSLSKDITLDLNGCTISGHFTNKTTQFVSIEAGAEVVINDASGKGGIKATSVEGTLSNLIRAQEGSKLTINGGNYTQDFSVNGAGMIDTRGDECITINNGTYVLGNVGTKENGSPWIFNAKGKNTQNIIVNGGSFTTDVAHQYWPFEVSMDYTKALKKENGMYTVVDAVAYVTEAEWSGRWYYNFVGYATLEEAIAACQGPQSYIYYGKKYTSEQEQVILLENIELTDALVIEANKSVLLDLNGFTISQTKECTGSYSMIENKGKLVIVDDWGGKISFTDTGKGDPNFGWGTYTIHNSGTLEINGGYIAHDGAQAFGTHCGLALFQYSGSTVINGGVFDSNYRSVRLWHGDMTINGGKFVGQVWVQAVANDASLTINGGKFQPVGGDKSSVFVTNSQYDVAFAVNGGTFASKIGVSVASKLTGCIANTGVIIIGTGTDEVLFAK